jgi:hypothetical protein
MTTVYVVTACTYGEFLVDSVWPTREQASDRIRLAIAGRRDAGELGSYEWYIDAREVGGLPSPGLGEEMGRG